MNKTKRNLKDILKHRHDPVEFICHQCGKSKFVPLKLVDASYYLGDAASDNSSDFECPRCHLRTLTPVCYQAPNGEVMATDPSGSVHFFLPENQKTNT